MYLSDLELLANGVFIPLTGLVVKEDHSREVGEMHLYGGLVWSVPVTLAVEDTEATQISERQGIALWQEYRL